MAMMQFELVSPERKLASVEASEVQIPGAEGDFTAMPDHAPVITTLRPGYLTVVTASGTEEYFVTGGFAEVSGESATVLAERAYAKADMTSELAAELVAEADEAHGAAGTDASAKLAADMAAGVAL
ncbi:ATP synthase F1 subunit epsilon [uncultured Litoreibacter sp.]|uniref:ATP synthase F1 subunit epsilon n=1 Tax=uncultured Litoreibacter sp. TaxID=1392394 RepID=UPI0026180D78|nr:ATP synthase F1 subunit epsilon [uncultured Litoreibacter sp.]